jgi:hypothetical protein
MQQNGIVFIVIAVDGKKGIRFTRIFAPGLLDIERDKQFVNTIASHINSHFGGMKLRSTNIDSKKVALKVKSLIKKERGKTPKVYVQIIS